MSAETQKTIQWLAECFREDRSRQGMVNFFKSNKVELRHVIKGEEKLLNGLLEEEVLSPAYGEKLWKQANLYRREKELVYGSLFISGVRNSWEVNAPIVFYSASLEQVGSAIFFKVHPDRWRFNWALLDTFKNENDLVDELRNLFVSVHHLDQAFVADLRKLMSKFDKVESAESLLSWPYLEKSGDLQKASKKEGFRLYSASALCLMDRSLGARGVLDELDVLKEQSDFSMPLRSFFQESGGSSELDKSAVHLPIVLSPAQENILRSARSRDITVCYGPPGTGKSLIVATVALDHVARGESVLIMSKNDHAIDVIERKIDDMLGNDLVTVRAGRSQHLSKLKKFLADCLAGVYTTAEPSGTCVKDVEKNLTRLSRQQEKIEEDYEKEISDAIQAGSTKSKISKNLLDKLKECVSDFSIRRSILLAEIVEAIYRGDSELEGLSRDWINSSHKENLRRVLEEKILRKYLKGILDALKKRRSAEQMQVFQTLDLKSILPALPVWLTNFDDVHQVLPKEKELFDLLIIDEASQCDLASVIPALQRARRVMIAGDPNQLRHVSFISCQVLHGYAKEIGLSDEVVERYHYRKRSLMDVVLEKSLQQDQIGFLNEHFRSERSIIQFSADQFYQGKLSLMRHRDWEQAGGGLKLIPVSGESYKERVNLKENESIIKRLRDILEEDKALGREEKRSVGVLSPFRNQVDAIVRNVQLRFNAQELNTLLQDHSLMVATAHGFQGEERDIMLISFVLSDADPAGAFRYAERVDVFNVSITRAKLIQEVYFSFDAKKLKPESLLRKYVSQVTEYPVEKRSSSHDAFAKEVAATFSKLGLTVIPERVLAGMLVDLVVIKNGKTVGIDLVGYPGHLCKGEELQRLRLARRAGLNIYPIGYSEWQLRKDDLLAFFERLM